MPEVLDSPPVIIIGLVVYYDIGAYKITSSAVTFRLVI